MNEAFKNCTFKNPNDAFNEAIAKGELSRESFSPRYAGNWMYMHTDSNGDAFKNIITRKYIWVK